MTVSGNGQVSIPAGARARWKTRQMIVVDLGDRVVMRPAPDEPVEKLEGKYRTRGPSSDQAGAKPARGRRAGGSPVTVLDAYAVIAFLRAEPAAGEVRALLGTDAQLTSVGVAEVLDHLVRVVGADEEEATLDLAQLGILDGTVVDSAIGAEAGRLRARGTIGPAAP